MSRHAISEFSGKSILERYLTSLHFSFSSFRVRITSSTDFALLEASNPWLLEHKLVAKPDQLIKRRGKSGLLKLNASWSEVVEWVKEHMGKTVMVGNTSGVLESFIVEPFVEHDKIEFYVCIQSQLEYDEILFTHEGGVDVGDVDSKASRMRVLVQDSSPSVESIQSELLSCVQAEKKLLLAQFIKALHECFASLHFCYLEINPLVINEGKVYILDLAAKLDECAKFEVGKKWGAVDFPPPFGRPLTREEAYIADLDSKTGSSLKLTILNEKGRIWTMTAGGGASVIYADTICDMGAGSELANYGEYSGDPSEELTFEYAKTVISLLTKHSDPRGKILLIGGGIANFTNVAETFKGIIRALTEFAGPLKACNTKIYVRRGGPNYQEGLSRMRAIGQTLNLDLFVYGPETHLTSIIAMALGDHKEELVNNRFDKPNSSLSFDVTPSNNNPASKSEAPTPKSLQFKPVVPVEYNVERGADIFSTETRAVVYGMQPGAVQNMLDFDYICGRTVPSVAAIVYEFTPSHHRKFYWGSKEFMLPVYDTLVSALTRYSDVNTVVSFASSRSVYESTIEILKFSNQIKTIAIIAEGVPERRTRIINQKARVSGVTIIGPATVGGIKPGSFRIGNAGGMLDNIIASKLYRPGSVAYVSKSGGLSNELNNIIGQYTDGVCEGIAIGGDQYPCSSFIDHIARYENNPNVKMIVLLGEVGGLAEYDVINAVKEGKIKKPVVAWCTGTVAKMFSYDVQFGHAGALANSLLETADSKNNAMRAVGIIVPNSFQDFHTCISSCFEKLKSEGKIVLKKEPEPPKIPIDYDWARKLGLIRKSSHFVSSICDERGEELTYAGNLISDILQQGLGIGGVVGLLWFRKKLPDYATKFIEMILIVTADHGPAVSGAHNTIVTTRAGKDLVSSLCSGLLTIGPKFGGALDEAAEKFSSAFDKGLSPDDFVQLMRKQKELIPGIGHKKKSVQNPDKRVQLVVEYVKKHFATTELLDYALAVEQVTTRKKSNLILNVDGAIACSFVDLLRGSGIFTSKEAKEYIAMGLMNGLFVLGRTVGFIGHYIDQKRLKQGLYRHPEEDIAYIDALDEFL